MGFFVQIVKSIANGSLSVLNRIMQSIEVQVMMFYTSLISLIPMLIGLSLEKSLGDHETFRILNYTSE